MNLQPRLMLVIAALAELPLANRIIVFGSVARQAESPKDVDVALDVTGMDLVLDTKAIRQYERTIHGMTRIARQYYGCLDQFVIGNGRMLVRDAEATGYEVARNARAIRRNINAEGVPLSEVLERLVPSDAPAEDEADTSAPRG